MTRPLLFAALVVAWGNVAASILGSTAVLPGGSLAFAVAGVLLTLVSFAAARLDGLDARALLGSRRRALAGAAIGAGGSAAVAVLAVLFLRVVAPAITGAPMEYAPLARVTASQLAVHVVLLLPLGVVLPEEVAFRGALLALGLRRSPPARALALSAAAFALWHGAVILVTVADTTLGPPSPWFVPAALIALVVVFAGGALLALLRLWTGTIATTVVAHWLFDAALLAGLWATRAAMQPLA